KRQKRRSLATALALEEDWKFARGWVRKQAFIDGLAFVLWAVAFGFAMAGKRCPTGGKGQGCTAYNASTAAACLLSIVFAISIYFGVKDLYSSKLSPRTR
ncbi:hypothetical protein FA13DRAFT_1580637, partial [Coprinellus micaceus]